MGTEDKEKKAAVQDLGKMQADMDKLRELHETLGKHLDAYDKGHDALVKLMQQDDQKEQMKRWKIQQELQEKIFETIQDVTTNKNKVQDKSYKNWDAYIRG